jgi:hypothetical protein
MISMQSICAAIRMSLEIQDAERIANERFIEAKRQEQERAVRLWQQELARREAAELDEDGSRAAARRQREDEAEEQRLAEMTASIIRQTRSR